MTTKTKSPAPAQDRALHDAQTNILRQQREIDSQLDTILAQADAIRALSEQVADLMAQRERLREALLVASDQLAAILMSIGATSELLATVPRPSGPSSRTILDAIESGRAWASNWSEATKAVVLARAALAGGAGGGA